MAGFAENVYQSSPIWAQQITVGAYGWWWYKRRFGEHFHRLVDELHAREHWTTDDFLSYQTRQLRTLFEAARGSSYYRQVFNEAGVTPGMEPLTALRRMPLLSKDTLRTKPQELLTQSPLPNGTISFKSSGTTGTPTTIYYTREFHALELAAAEARNLHWAGTDYRDRRVMFGVRKVCRFGQDKPPFWRFSPAENMAYASIYHLSPGFLPDYLTFLRRYRPAIVMGYPSALNTIAAYALEHQDMPAPVKGVFTTSETVTADARGRIEAAFRSRVYDRYCAVEMCMFASQCEYGRYHTAPDIGVIEIVDSQGNEVPRGEMGEVVCTGLHNVLQPLIRYRIGDVARWASEQQCPCGRAMPILEAVEGRFEDVCYTPDGREIVRFDTVFKGVDSIREAQVIQERPDLFAIRVVPAEGFCGRDIETIRHNMHLHVGGAQADVTPVAAIPRTASGKFRAVICNLSAEDKRRIQQLRSPQP